MLENVSNQMQELRQGSGEPSKQDQVLRVSESYEHPWHQHIRKDLSLIELVSSPQKQKNTTKLSPQDLVFQEERRQRKVRRIDFEER